MGLLDPTDPEDALTLYYALHYPTDRVTVHVLSEQDQPVGFLAVCQAAVELWTPLVVMRTVSADVSYRLLHECLSPGREYVFAIAEWDVPPLERACRIWDRDHERIYTLRPADFEPVRHPALRRNDRLDGRVRFEIVLDGHVVSRAGTNWESPNFAEIGVMTDEAYRGRGLAKAVVSACTDILLERDIAPLYIASEENAASRQVCESLGYTFHGQREFACRGVP
jgi:RimJ/RimL family protein N-acetyltransferase